MALGTLYEMFYAVTWIANLRAETVQNFLRFVFYSSRELDSRAD